MDAEYNSPRKKGQKTKILGWPIIMDDAKMLSIVSTMKILLRCKWERKQNEWPSWSFSHKVYFIITEDLTTNKRGLSYLTISEPFEVM